MDDHGLRAHLDANGRPRIIVRRFVVPEEQAGVRADHFLKTQIPRLSRTRLQAIIRTAVTREGNPLKPNRRLSGGDILVLRREAQPEPPCPRRFDVLYDDADCMVVDKPAGLPVHASAKFYFNTLTRVMSERFPDQSLQIAHRLDRETSGCLVVARGKEAAATLKGAFEHKRVTKHYVAIVHGLAPWDDDDEIALPLRLVDPDAAAISVRMEPHVAGLPSVTRVRVLERRERCSLVRCSPITGRQHQIRAHLAAVGYPIVGDKLYAHGDEAFARYCDEGLTDELAGVFELPRHALHAASVAFPHPRDGAITTVTAPLPADMRDFLAAN